MPACPPPTDDGSTTLAGTQHASPLLPSQLPDGSTTPAGHHLSSSSGVQARNASTAPAGTQPFISKAARTGHEPFPKPAPHVFPMVRFAQPNPAGLAASSTPCTTCTASLFFSGTQAQRARIPRKSLVRPAVDFTRLSSKKAVIMLHESRTSSERIRVAPTSLSCSTWTRSRSRPLSSASPRPRPARTRGRWRPWSFVHCCVAHLSQALPWTRSAQSMSTMLWPRSATPQPLFFDVSTPTL